MDFIDYTLIAVCLVVSIITLYKLIAVIYTSYTYSRIDNDTFFQKYNINESLFLRGNYTDFGAPSDSSNRNIGGSTIYLKEELDNEDKPLIDGRNFKVFCASERSLSRFFNLFPWESIGLLSFDGSDIHFVGYKSRTTTFFRPPRKLMVRYRFPRNQVRISYIPPNFLKDGGLEWMKLEAHRHKFYFTSGHSKKIKLESNEATTRMIYEMVSEF